MLLWAATANAVSYNIAVLNSFGGDSSAYGMNDNGQVVGNAYNSDTGQTEAVIWDAGVVTSLGFEGIARAVNNSGTVVGENGAQAVINKTGDGRAYKWDSTNGYEDLGDLNGIYAGAWDINDSGVITGNSFFNTDSPFGLLKMHAFRWENGTMTDLVPPNPTDGYSRGIGINDNGTIIGRASVDLFAGSDKYMGQWDSANTFTHDDPPGNYSSGRDINNSEVGVGIARTGVDTFNRAAMWDENGSITIFGTFGGERSQLTAINDSGIAVGMAQALDGLGANVDTAMITYDGSTILDLNTLVNLAGTGLVSLDEAFDINANGDIVGVGTLSDGTRVLTAVPVPAAVWLFASALGALGWLRRKPRV